MKNNLQRRLIKIYDQLFHAYGNQHWWPADSPFEVIIGAILTQNTSWSNVEKAISNLKLKNKLDPKRLFEMEIGTLAHLIRSSGFFNQKAKKIRNFLKVIFNDYGGNLNKMFQEDISSLREKLLKINGIGHETADSILLYACHKPIFVVDAYTHRILNRQGLVAEDCTYQNLQEIFMENLPHDEKLFNEYHALFVKHGKTICKKKPICENCTIRETCYFNNNRSI